MSRRYAKTRFCSIVASLLLGGGCEEPVSDDEASALETEEEEEIVDEDDVVDESGESGGIDEPTIEPELASELDPQAVTTLGLWSWGTPGNDGPPLDLGPTNDRTCFLVGVTGDLDSAWNATRASVQVYMSGNRWLMRTNAGTGAGVMGHATCIAVVGNRRTISWVGNTIDSENSTFSWVEDTGTTKCFLTSVSGSVGWASPDSFVSLRRKTIYGFGDPKEAWHLRGNLLTEQDGTSGGSAAAVCVDTYQLVTGYDFTGPGTDDIMSATKTTCGIHVLEGNYAAAPAGWWDGARVVIDATNTWEATANSGKRIAGECYKTTPYAPAPGGGGWP